MADISDWHWRNTMRPARFYAFDARAVSGILVVLFHIRLWTLMIAILIMVVFWIAERAGYEFDATIRRMRCFLIGPMRPTVALIGKRRLKDYGR